MSHNVDVGLFVLVIDGTKVNSVNLPVWFDCVTLVYCLNAF